MLVSAALTSLLPHVTSIRALLTVFIINQIGMGAFEAGSNMFLIHLWGREMTPFMQAMNLMFGAGALIAPLIAAPFLYEKERYDHRVSDINVTRTAYHEVFHPEEIHLFWPFSIVAAFLLVNALFSFAVWRIFPATDSRPSRQPDSSPKSKSTGSAVTTETSVVSRSNFPVQNGAECGQNVYSSQVHESDRENVLSMSFNFWKLMAVILTLFFLHIYLGVEIAIGSFMTTFAVRSKLNLSKSDGAHLTTLFWTTFTLFRIPPMFYIDFVGQEVNIFASLFILLNGSALLVPFGEVSIAVLWVGVALVGVGMSSVWACMFGFLEEYFPITPFISACMIVSAMLGEFVFPVIISAYINENAGILLWVTLFCSLAVLMIFTAISVICRFMIGKRKA